MIVFLIHAWVNFYLFQFVRYYDWEVVKAWAMATFWSVVHRLFTAPFIRMIWVLVVLMVSRRSGLFDRFTLSTAAAMFPDTVQLDSQSPAFDCDDQDSNVGDDDGGNE